MRAIEFILEGSSITYAIYVNGKPVMKYHDEYTLQKELAIVKNKFPNRKFTVEREVCKTSEIDPTNIR